MSIVKPQGQGQPPSRSSLQVGGDLGNGNLQFLQLRVKVNLAFLVRGCNMASMLEATDITEMRRSLGMTLREFGDLVGVSEATVSRWEANKSHPPFKTMKRISELVAQARAAQKPAKREKAGV